MLCIDDLLTLELFQQLPKERLEWVCDRAQVVELTNGEILVKEGDPPRGFFVLLSGCLEITRKSRGADIPVGRHEAPSFLGEIPVLTEEPVLVTVRALNHCRLYEIAGDDFRKLLHECRDFERMVFQAVQRRTRGLESFIRNREKMAALGTLAAGLAHELNNPAAVVVRAMQDVVPAMLELQRMNLVYGQRNVEEEHTKLWIQVRDEGCDAIVNDRVDPLTLSEREEELLEWLEAYGVENAWKLAEPIAAAGVEIKTLEKLTERWKDDPTELRDIGLRWLALSFDVMGMITSGLRGAQRISALVQSMKAYSHLDQGEQQIVDIHEGLEDTLRLFSYKIKQGIDIRRLYDHSLPEIAAYGSELNQLWTILLDNAIDAIPEQGAIEITTALVNNFIQVQITDSGSGIPPEIQSRIFEPFFTTKPVGQGSGLGLELARRIVENRHRGNIMVESKLGRTTFTVSLPIVSE